MLFRSEAITLLAIFLLLLLLFREIGRVVAPGPFVSTVLGARVAALRLGMGDAEGERRRRLVVAVAHVETDQGGCGAELDDAALIHHPFGLLDRMAEVGQQDVDAGIGPAGRRILR